MVGHSKHLVEPMLYWAVISHWDNFNLIYTYTHAYCQHIMQVHTYLCMHMYGIYVHTYTCNKCVYRARILRIVYKTPMVCYHNHV